MLFDAAADGIEDGTDPKADVVNLRFNDWFKPFNDESVIHPFLDEGRATPALSRTYGLIQTKTNRRLSRAVPANAAESAGEISCPSVLVDPT